MKLFRGTTLIELTIVVALLSVLIVGSFLIFQQGSRGFQNSVMRVGAVGDAERFSRNAGRDVRLTHFRSLGTVNRQISLSGKSLRRDGICMATLSDWSSPSRYLVTGLPDWDRYVVYYATEEVVGRLIRLEINPAGGPFMAAPLPSLGNYLLDDPRNVPGYVRSSVLSKDVRSLEISVDPTKDLVNFRLRMSRTTGKRMTSEFVVEEYQDIQLSLWPLNSYAEI